MNTEIKPIAHSYWRSIKRKNSGRTYASVPEELKDDVLALAVLDVQNGVITEVQFETYIGKPYAEVVNE